jgi:hypothetical protein
MVQQHHFNWKRILGYFIFFVFGVCYRILIINISPQPFWFDQFEYHQFALGILSHGLFYVESARSYGYPLIVALLYTLFGTEHIVWQLFNIVADTATAFIVYATVKRLTRSDASAWCSLIIALFNPFTAAYTGMLLTESVSVFLMACILFCFILWLDNPKQIFVYILAALLGFFPQVRPGFLYFDLSLIGYILWKLAGTHDRIWKIFLATALFCVWFVPPAIGNYRTFGAFSATTADNLVARELYISIAVNGPSPHPANSLGVFPISVQHLYEEYSNPTTNIGRRAMANKYWDMSMTLIQHDPIGFVRSRIEKFWYVWQKTYIYYFTYEPLWSRAFAYWLNIGYLAFAAAGFIIMRLRRNTNFTISRFLALSTYLVLYITVAHSITLAEERYSLPGYPTLWIFAGYGCIAFIRTLNRQS